MTVVQQRALVIGEHPAIRRLVRLNLHDLPLEVRETNTAQARDQVVWDLPHLVVVDLNPPVEQGLALCRQLRLNPTTATIPAVLLIEGGDADLRVQAGKAGATICVDKPFRPWQLRGTVQNLLASPSHRAPAPASNSDDALHSPTSMNEAQVRLAGARLVAHTAHHLLNTPLSLALGYSELLADDTRVPAELREMANEVVSAIESAEGLLRRLLRINHLEERDPNLPGGPILDLAKSVRDSP